MAETRFTIVFRVLKYTVDEVCELAKPIIPNLEPNKYLEYFLTNIDFEKIESIYQSPSKEEGRKNCNTIYFGLDQLLKADIDRGFSAFQRNLSSLKTFELFEIQNMLIDTIGLLERQSRTNLPGISFAERFNRLYPSIESKERLFPIDYQMLIGHFNEVILNDLLSSYKILNGTIGLKIQIPLESRILLNKAIEISETDKQSKILENEKQPIAVNLTWKELIDPIILESRLPYVESKILTKIEDWKQGINLIECAAFCEIMFEKKWFNNGLTNRAAPYQFALSKYGANIKNQLLSKSKKNRNTHKSKLQRYFL